MSDNIESHITDGQGDGPNNMFMQDLLNISSEEMFKLTMWNISNYLERNGVDWEIEEDIW